jgi:hypothetical protein
VASKKTGKVFVLASTDPKAENGLVEPMKVAPVEKQLPVPAAEFVFEAGPNSVNVLRVGRGGK